MGKHRKYKGVQKPRKANNSWCTRIQIPSENMVILEYYTCEHTAAYAYNIGMMRYHPNWKPHRLNDLTKSGFTVDELEAKLITDRSTKYNRAIQHAKRSKTCSGVRRSPNAHYPGWIPVIHTSDETYNLGVFKYEEHAIIAYKAIKKHLKATGVEVLEI